MDRISKLTLPAIFGAALLAACGPTLEAPGEHETREQPLERICGANRYTGIQGVDVSTYQQNYDWQARKNEGIVFGIARVSNGTGIIDDYFDRNWSEMKDKGILRGAYQYFRPGQDATAQANLMVNKLGMLQPGDLPAVIDVETTDGESAATVRQKVRTWLEIVEAGTGRKPMIYTSGYFWRDEVGETGLGDYPLWVANYAAECPLVPDSNWDDWTLWQYCDGNPDYCDNGAGYDRNVFNGTMEELEALAGLNGYGATFVDQSFPLASTPLEMEAGETVSGWIELENTGGMPWGGQTHLATTEPRDRASVFADESWIAPNRPAVVDGVVAPGETYRFEFNLRAPDEPGEYAEFFGLVQDGTAWFSDAGHQGPADDQLQIAVTVTEAPGPTNNDTTDPDPEPTNNDTVDPDPMDVDDPTDDEPVVPGGAVPPLVGESPGIDGGCSHARGASNHGLLVLLGLAFAWLRRR